MEAIEDKLTRPNKNRLAQECAKLHQAFEQSIAEERLSSEREVGCNIQAADNGLIRERLLAIKAIIEI